MNPPEILPVCVITPHTGIDAFTGAIRSTIRDFPQARALAWRMFLRDTRAMYRQSLLGYVWLLLPPLANTFVWVLLNKQNLVTIDSGDVPYTVFVLSGNLLWAAFNGAVMGMLGIMGEARGVLSKVNFPHEALVYSSFIKAALNATVPVILIVPALPYYGISLSATMVLFPIGLFAIMLIGSAIGLAFVPVAALYSDVARALQLGLRFAFFFTPVIYALPKAGRARTILLTCNPMTAPLVTTRTWLVGGGESMPMAFLAIVAVSLVLFVVSIIIFKVAMPHIIERLNS